MTSPIPHFAGEGRCGWWASSRASLAPIDARTVQLKIESWCGLSSWVDPGEAKGGSFGVFAADARQTSASNAEVSNSSIPGMAVSGAEIAFEFKPVEHPTEPLNRDQPVRCPLPEPSILNDGRIWKERRSAGTQARDDRPPAKGGSHKEPEASRSGQLPTSSKLAMLPSHSAPEHSIINLLEECSMARV